MMLFKATLDQSQMTIAGAVQCRYPRSTIWKSTFLLRKKKSHFFLKCLDLSFSLFLSSAFLFLEVCSSLITSFFFFSFFLLYCISASFFISRSLVSLQEADSAYVDTELLV